MKRLIIFAFLAILVTASYSGEGYFIGKFNLYLPYTANYQNHYLEIKSISGNSIKGVVGLDFSIGPQARMPSLWEKLHEIPFEGEFDVQKKKLTFFIAVPLGRETQYYFHGFLMDIENVTSIVGVYWMNQEEEGGFFAKKEK